jgi:hypothetical protein
MQFRTIRTALDHDGEVTYIRDLTPRSRGIWFCRSCNNPLRLHWTHDSGYFKHDQEDADECRLTHCEYRIITQDKPVSTFDQAVNALMECDDVYTTAPSKRITSACSVSMNIMIFDAVQPASSISTARK